MIRYAIKVTGIVQGVGFRPFVFRLAYELSLSGFVRNTSQGVRIEIEGKPDDCTDFILRLTENPPPLAHIEKIDSHEIPVTGKTGFEIMTSSEGTNDTFISPDIGICAHCARDVTQMGNRRFRYSFTNCTNCGPRFSITFDVPYDRKNTTMADFEQCCDCESEYKDPNDRRFHAQPNACPVCGPKLSFYKNAQLIDKDPYEMFKQSMENGEIVALKGIGGFHLVCDALNEQAVRTLRERKQRYDKPFAVMIRDIETVEKYCEIDETEKKVLLSTMRPIVLLKKKIACTVAPSTTLTNKRLGVMLPYTPLHSILMQDQEILIMTSGNLSDNPMIFDDDEAFDILLNTADALLTHNRQIFRRVDDSVAIVINGKTHMIRRARGYVPGPLSLTHNTSNLLAVGAQQKNTFCLVKGKNAFMSGHIGDLDDEGTSRFFEREIESFAQLFNAKPEAIVCDMHPDYISTRYVSKYAGKLPIYQVQHHHAHFASVLAEHEIIENGVLGLIFDGTGYGEDGTIWGGEALLGNIGESRRVGHLLTFPLFGGEVAVREPWRTALAVSKLSVGTDEALKLFSSNADKAKLLLQAGERGINTPYTSSMGRLFDAVSALCGLITETTYEGQAAIEFQQVIDESAHGSYHFELIKDYNSLIFDWRPLIHNVISDIKAGIPCGVISLRFHRAVLELMVGVCQFARDTYGISKVAISGGVFQNDYLLKNSIPMLTERGFLIYTNEKIPANDGGISFGQAAAISYRMGE